MHCLLYISHLSVIPFIFMFCVNSMRQWITLLTHYDIQNGLKVNLNWRNNVLLIQ